MIFLRIILFSALTILTGVWTYDLIVNAFFFDNPNIIVIDGLLSMCGTVGSLWAAIYIIIYSIKEQFNLTIPIGEINKMIIIGLFLCLVIASSLNFKIHSNISQYVECTDARKISSRYSSQTYALSTSLCLQLAEEHEK